MRFSLKNKIILITGASSGIGEACAKIFAEQGAKLLLCARRKDRLDALIKQLEQNHQALCYAIQLDVRDQKAVDQAIHSLPAEWQAIDVLVNNAGLASGLTKIQDGHLEDWEKMIDTNIKGLLYMTHAVLPAMIKRNHGHVINIGSIAGHETYPMGNVYCATKHAVMALTKGFRHDLLGTPIRVSSVDPGMVETEFSIVRFKGDEARAKQFYQDMQPLVAEDIADAVCYCASRPLHVNVLDLVITPTAQASATQVWRGK